MYYKVMKNDKVIDVLDQLTYLKWQPRNKIMLLSDFRSAQAILSSDGNTIWHEIGLRDLPAEAGEYDDVELIPIDKYEYDQLRILNLKTPEEIADELILYLVNNGII